MGEIAEDCYDRALDEMFEGDDDCLADAGFVHRPPCCNRCGSTDVRWRQQGGKWVLFSLQPGVVHSCASADDFDEVPL